MECMHADAIMHGVLVVKINACVGPTSSGFKKLLASQE